MIRYIGLFLSLFLFLSCGSTTKVILLPDSDGKVGKAVVKNQAEQTVLETPYASTEVRNDSGEMTQSIVEKKEIEERYQTLFSAEPLKPVSYVLYFQHDSTILTNASRKLIPEILETARQREPSIVSIIGHTDSKGKDEYNYTLALERAERVAAMLRNSGTNLKDMVVTSHGENDPLIRTGDNVSESRNRRVEIMIR